MLTITILSACNGADNIAKSPKSELIRPLKITQVAPLQGNSERQFTALVGAGQSTELAFRVAGQLENLDVKEGQKVAQGQLIATLDSTDFDIILADAKAQYQLATLQYERIKKLAEQKLAAKSELDSHFADVQVKLASLNKAQQQLKYTQLKAPFSGVIAQKHADLHDHITNLQPIFTFQSDLLQDVSFDLPEKMIRQFNPSKLAGIKAYVVLDAYPDVEIPAYFKEMQKHSQSNALSYRVTYAMQASQSLNVLPGMSAIILLRFEQDPQQHSFTKIPLGALFSDETEPLKKNKKFVWVIDTEHKAQQREVVVAHIEKDGAVIKSGLEAGENIASTAPTRLIEGQKVKALQRERGL